jgi:hypothetical protein
VTAISSTRRPGMQMHSRASLHVTGRRIRSCGLRVMAGGRHRKCHSQGSAWSIEPFGGVYPRSAVVLNRMGSAPLPAPLRGLALRWIRLKEIPARSPHRRLQWEVSPNSLPLNTSVQSESIYVRTVRPRAGAGDQVFALWHRVAASGHFRPTIPSSPQ